MLDHSAGPRARRPRRKRHFSSTEHLSPEAVAAFADDELTGSAAHRARVHLVQCDLCRFDTHSQRGTADWLRGTHLAEDVRAPRDLVARLASLSAGPLTPGPDADALQAAGTEDFFDRMATTFRALRRRNGRGAER
ncbi:MAG: hypothetical protein Q4F37_01535 [Corynebacterium sp.]|uniref:hypothetical protein n=1 Tax=Corynebacterium sp. TaxID=1720 RepID=UPI0027016774|nr:hypothetical protein [Corynebacterium sp.]